MSTPRRSSGSGRLDHREPEVCRGLGENAGRVCDGDIALRGDVYVDVVVADAELSDDLEIGPGGIHHRCIDGIGDVGEDAVCVCCCDSEFIRFCRGGAVQDEGIRDLVKSVDLILKLTAGHKDLRAGTT